MKRQRHFTVYIDWHYGAPETTYERCIISPTKKLDIRYDGYNWVGRGGNEGMEIFISSSLENAIKDSHFNPFAIIFEGLKRREKKLKELEDAKKQVEKYNNCDIEFYFENGKISKIVASYLYDNSMDIVQTYKFSYKDEAIKIPAATIKYDKDGNKIDLKADGETKK